MITSAGVVEESMGSAGINLVFKGFAILLHGLGKFRHVHANAGVFLSVHPQYGRRNVGNHIQIGGIRAVVNHGSPKFFVISSKTQGVATTPAVADNPDAVGIYPDLSGIFLILNGSIQVLGDSIGVNLAYSVNGSLSHRELIAAS